MVFRASIRVRSRLNYSLKDLDIGFSSSWFQVNLRYSVQVWRKVFITVFWRSFGEFGRREVGQEDQFRLGRKQRFFVVFVSDFDMGDIIQGYGQQWIVGKVGVQSRRFDFYSWIQLLSQRGFRGSYTIVWIFECLVRFC